MPTGAAAAMGFDTGSLVWESRANPPRLPAMTHLLQDNSPANNKKGE